MKLIAEVGEDEDRQPEPALEHGQLGFLFVAHALIDLNLRLDDVRVRDLAAASCCCVMSRNCCASRSACRALASFRSAATSV